MLVWRSVLSSTTKSAVEPSGVEGIPPEPPEPPPPAPDPPEPWLLSPHAPRAGEDRMVGNIAARPPNLASILIPSLSCLRLPKDSFGTLANLVPGHQERRWARALSDARCASVAGRRGGSRGAP